MKNFELTCLKAITYRMDRQVDNSSILLTIHGIGLNQAQIQICHET